jgi:cation diffusion facilitator CzcD-associated flavoprotein CzcO
VIDPAELQARFPDVTILDKADISAVFDDATDSWLLQTNSGDARRARVVVDAQRTLHHPLQPNYPGHTTFRGPAFHTAHWDTAFDAAGKRIAVIGDRAAHVIPLLTETEVSLFDCSPSWQTRKTKRRWLPHAPTKRGPQAVTSAIERITATGIRTVDGADHAVDAIVYATGSATRNDIAGDALVGAAGLTIQRAWQDGAHAYVGVAVHGFPNYFMLLGPDSPVGDSLAVAGRQLRYIVECLERMERSGSTRIEVRRSAQQQYTQRAHVKPPASAFDLGRADVQYEIYDGPATLTVANDHRAVRVRLTGHLDPIDGKYHWQGTASGAGELPPGSGPLTLTTGAFTSQARITEQTPWGSYSIAGVGAPPYELDHPVDQPT